MSRKDKFIFWFGTTVLLYSIAERVAGFLH